MADATKWQPSPAQKRLLTVIQAKRYDISVCDACIAANVPRQTYYNWFRDSEEFRAWWQSEMEGYFLTRLTHVYGALAGAATATKRVNRTCGRVDVQAAKLLLERFDRGYSPKSRVQHEGSIDLGHASRDEIQRLCREFVGGVTTPPAPTPAGPEIVDPEVS